MDGIDWKRVDERLRCPICGDRAHIAAGTDGYEAEHTHRFSLSRAEALRLSQPDPAERLERIAQLEAEIRTLRDQTALDARRAGDDSLTACENTPTA